MLSVLRLNLPWKEMYFVRYVHTILIILFLAIALLACQTNNSSRNLSESAATQALATSASSEAIQSSSTDVVGDPLQSDPTPEVSEIPSNPALVEKFISLSKKDLASRLQIDENEVILVQTEEMVWPNAALGCPAPGKVYAQGRVPGFQIWLETGGLKYVYNTDRSGTIILCMLEKPDGSVVPFSTAGPEINVPIK